MRTTGKTSQLVRRTFWIQLLIVLAVSQAIGTGCKKNEQEIAKTELQEFADQILKEHNEARTNPKAYAEKYIKPLIGSRHDAMDPAKGISYAQECYNEMMAMESAQALKLDPNYIKASQFFANDHFNTKTIGHVGSDGSHFTDRLKRFGGENPLSESCSYGCTTAQKVAVQLLIDRGESSRGHRRNFLNPKARVIGVGKASGKGIPYGTVVVIDYGH